MFGRKEIVSVVEEVKNEVVGIGGNFTSYIDAKFDDKEKRDEARYKVMEQRIKRYIQDTALEIMQKQNEADPKNIVKHIKMSEEDDRVAEQLESIKGKILRVHSVKSKEDALVVFDDNLKKYRYTEVGETVYEIISANSRSLGELLGVGISTFTNRHKHKEFCRNVDVDYKGKTEILSSKGNGNYNTGWSTFIKEGLIDDYVDFFITKFIDVEINKRKGDD